MISRDFFGIPEFADDEQSRHAHVMLIACIVSTVCLSIFLVYYGFFNRSYNILPLGILLLITFLSFIILRRGATNVAAHVMAWTIVSGILCLALINDGLYDTSLQVIPAVLIVGAVVLGRRQLIVISLFSLVSIIVLALLESDQVLVIPIRAHRPMVDVFDIIIVDGTTVILVMLVSSYLKESMQQLRHEQVRLSDSEARFRTLYENLSIGLYRTTPAGRIVLANPALISMLGYSSFEELAAKDLTSDDFDPTYDRNEFITRIEAEGVIHGLESIWTRRDGTTICVRETARAVRDAAGRTLYYDGTVEDITERKRVEEALHKSEERFTLSMEATHDGLWDWNIVTDEGYFSPGYYSMLGYDPDTFAAEGNVWKDLIHPDDRKYTLQSNMDCIEGKCESFEVEYRMRAKNGEWRWILGRGKTIERDDTGRAVRMVGTHVDITERRTTEQLMRDMQRRESIGILSGGIAHDFNNLLGSMMGHVTLAQAYLPDDHPAGANLSKALAAIDRATELTRQMLAYSGKGKFQIRTIDVGAVIEEHTSLFTVSLPKNVAFETHLPASPVFVNGDPEQLEQVVMNLIVNGGESIGERQGVVSISLSEVGLSEEDAARYATQTNVRLGGGAYALLEVRDNGQGMSDDIKAKIFDPFFTTKFIGRGLGLSAVLGIIHGHKGGMTVDSVVEHGTTFRVIIPAVVPPLPHPIGLETNEAPSSPPSNRSILVIDDEQDVAMMAQEILETGNYSTFIALDPVTGVELYRTHGSDISLVLLDLTMPQMSGREVVDALKSIHPNVKIIITSGYSEEEVTKKLDAVTTSGFIQKPYRLQALLALVNKVIG